MLIFPNIKKNEKVHLPTIRYTSLLDQTFLKYLHFTHQDLLFVLDICALASTSAVSSTPLSKKGKTPFGLLPDGSIVNNSQCKVISRSSPVVRARRKMLLSKELYQGHCLWLVNLYEQQDLTSRSEDGLFTSDKVKGFTAQVLPTLPVLPGFLAVD